jgi:hypothetical protein
MDLKPSVAELQKEHVVMELECIDRMYLSAKDRQAGYCGMDSNKDSTNTNMEIPPP